MFLILSFFTLIQDCVLASGPSNVYTFTHNNLSLHTSTNPHTAVTLYECLISSRSRPSFTPQAHTAMASGGSLKGRRESQTSSRCIQVMRASCYGYRSCCKCVRGSLQVIRNGLLHYTSLSQLAVTSLTHGYASLSMHRIYYLGLGAVTDAASGRTQSST